MPAGKYKRTPAIRAKMSKAHKGKKLTKEHAEKIRQSNIGRKHSKESIKNMSDGRKGFKHLAESKLKISNANKGKKRTKEFIRKLKESRLGENNPNWKDGATDSNKLIRNSPQYKVWRKKCLSRDNFVCQKTGVSGGELIVHHINNFADFPELRFKPSNGITLCRKAHYEFHKIYGKKNNAHEQLLEFLNAYNTIMNQIKRQPCEIFSRVNGYLRPVNNWNDAKQQEFSDRKTFKVKK